MTIYTVNCAYDAPYGNTVTVEAASVAEACRLAIEKADAESCWNPFDPGQTYVDAIAEGEEACAFDGEQVKVPMDYRAALVHPDVEQLVKALTLCKEVIERRHMIRFDSAKREAEAALRAIGASD